MSNNPTYCSTEGACPFSFTDESEIVQNYGCLPAPLEIVQMRQAHNKTWACHSNPNKPCLGALNYMKEKGLPYKILDPVYVTEKDNWGKYTK